MKGEKNQFGNKALVLDEKGHRYFSFIFCLKKFCSIKNQVCTAIILDKSPGYVITVRFHPQFEDWWLTRQSGLEKNDSGYL